MSKLTGDRLPKLRNFSDAKRLNRNRGKRLVKSEREKRGLEEDICIHIFTVSSAMVGVCLTVIGLVRVVITLGESQHVGGRFACDGRVVIPHFLLSFLRRASLARRSAHAPD